MLGENADAASKDSRLNAVTLPAIGALACIAADMVHEAVGQCWVASFAIGFVDRAQVAVADSRRLVWPAYLAAGVVLTVASIFNPISPSLILGSGVGPAFGLNCGFLFLPPIIARHATDQGVAEARIPFSAFWLILSLVVSGLFIGVLGPGIHFFS